MVLVVMVDWIDVAFEMVPFDMLSTLSVSCEACTVPALDIISFETLIVSMLLMAPLLIVIVPSVKN